MAGPKGHWWQAGPDPQGPLRLWPSCLGHNQLHSIPQASALPVPGVHQDRREEDSGSVVYGGKASGRPGSGSSAGSLATEWAPWSFNRHTHPLRTQEKIGEGEKTPEVVFRGSQPARCYREQERGPLGSLCSSCLSNRRPKWWCWEDSKDVNPKPGGRGGGGDGGGGGGVMTS